MNRALITLTLEPALIYEGDRVTVRWSVRNPNPNLAWNAPVSLRASFRTNPALPERVANSGSHSFIAGSAPENGTFTLGTGAALFHAERTIAYRVELRPSISWFLVENSRGDFNLGSRAAAGDRVEIRGTHFGLNSDHKHVELAINRQTLTLPIIRWSDTSIVVRIPNNAPPGSGSIRVIKGNNRLASNAVAFTVFGSITITNAILGIIANQLGLDSTLIHLDKGDNASSISFSAPMRQRGVTNLSFTVPKLEINSPLLGDIVQSLVIPFGSRLDKLKYEVNDINSNRLTLGVANGDLVISLGFESEGAEVTGRARLCTLAGLSCDWSGGAAPDVQVNNASVIARLTPGVAGGNLIFTSASATFNADFQIGSNFEDSLIRRLTDYKGQIRNAVNQALTTALNRPAVRSALGSAVMAELRSRGVNRVTSVSANGNSLVVRFE
jgi:hypothetical protein